MRTAWGYVFESIVDELSGAESLLQYRAGGGSVRTQDWYYLRRTAGDVYAKSRSAEGWESTLTLPESVYTETNLDMAMPYKATAEATYIDPVSGLRKHRSVSVLDTESKSFEEWEEHLRITYAKYGVDLAAEGSSLGRIWFTRTMP